MGVNYQAVLWNRQKRIYDTTLLVGIGLYVAVFALVTTTLNPNITAETLIIRATATLALALLHVILSIGPLARLDPRFLPLLYNRRHLGVTMFLVAFVHGVLSIFQFHVAGDLNPLVSLFVSNTDFGNLSQFPFQPLGFGALSILFLMAATSHDFWLANLSAPAWKSLHMLVYVAYTLVIMHVALGVLQAETHPALSALLIVGFVWVLGLHAVAGWRERVGDVEIAPASAAMVRACAVDDIDENRARIVTVAGERIAIFRFDGRISAVSNVCQHQNGPLGEGCIIDGLITCPWHGYQYHPDSGSSPPPFTETIPTFSVEVRDGDVWVDPRPHPPGTRLEPAAVEGT